MGSKILMLVKKGKIIINATLINDTLADILPMVLTYFLPFLSPLRVLCINTCFVPESNANPVEISIDPKINHINEFPIKKQSVDNNIENFAIINVFFWPNLSEKYPVGISNKNDAR